MLKFQKWIYHDLRFQILLWISVCEVELDIIGSWHQTGLLKCSLYCLKLSTIFFSVIILSLGIYLLSVNSRILSSVLNFRPVASFITLNLKVSRKYLGMVGWLPKDFIHNTEMAFHNSTFSEQLFVYLFVCFKLK